MRWGRDQATGITSFCILAKVLSFSFLFTYPISGRRCHCVSGTPDSIRSQEGKPRCQPASPGPAASPPLCPMLSGLRCPQPPTLLTLTVPAIWITGNSKTRSGAVQDAKCWVLLKREVQVRQHQSLESCPGVAQATPLSAIQAAGPLPLHLPACHCSLSVPMTSQAQSPGEPRRSVKFPCLFLGAYLGLWVTCW